MKKLFLFLAVAGLISFASCKSGETKAEASEDTTMMEQTAPEEGAMDADTAVMPE